MASSGRQSVNLVLLLFVMNASIREMASSGIKRLKAGAQMSTGMDRSEAARENDG